MSRFPCPPRDPALGPRRGPHSGVRSAGDARDGQDAGAARCRRARLRDGARQHVPSVPGPRPGPDRRVRRPQRADALGGADHHRLRRLSGVLDGARRRGRRDQGPPRSGGVRRLQRHDIGDRGGGRAVSLLPGRQRAVHGPGDLDGDAGGDRIRHRPGVRRVHSVPRHPGLHGPVDGAHPPLA